MKKSFILYENYWRQLQLLDFEQCGRLLKAIFAHECGKKLPELDAMTQMLYSVIADQLDRDRAKYEEVSVKRAEAGRKGAAVTNSAYAKKAAIADDNENENEKKTVNENEKENENENENEEFEELPPDVDPAWRQVYHRIMARRFGEKRLQNRLKKDLQPDRDQDRTAEKSGFV